MVNVKKICFLAMLTIILFVQEEALNFIPSVQFTFMLIALYACVVGIYNSSLIVLVHVILDNIVMGSFSPTIMIPMFIGYEITIIIAYLLRRKMLGLLITGVSIGVIIYSLCFLVTNSFIFEINISDYLIADIPFTAILIASTVISMLFLLEPLKKILDREWIRINNLEN